MDRSRTDWRHWRRAAGLAGLLLGLIGCLSATGAEPEPDLARTSLHDVYRKTRNGRQGLQLPPSTLSEGEPFLVVGILARGPGEEPDSRGILVDYVGSCCSFFPVGLTVWNAFDFGFKPDELVAVYGRLSRRGSEWTASSAPFQGKTVLLGGDDLGIEVARMVPAAEVIYDKNLAETIGKGGAIGRFADLLEQSDLIQLAQLEDNLTILVPHNQGMESLHPGDLSGLDSAERKARLRHRVLGHMVRGRLSARDLMRLDWVTMMNGDRHRIVVNNGSMRIGGSRILMKNLLASNGNAHIITPALTVSPYRRTPAPGSVDPERIYDPLGQADAALGLTPPPP